MTRFLTPSLVAVALLAPAAAATEIDVPVPGTTCSVTVAVTDPKVYLSNPPKLGTSGDTGVWTDCP